MNSLRNTNLAIIASLALALASGSPVQAQSDKPVQGKMMMKGKMMERCQEMQGQKEKMLADMKAQDTALTLQVAEMNGAPET